MDEKAINTAESAVATAHATEELMNKALVEKHKERRRKSVGSTAGGEGVAAAVGSASVAGPAADPTVEEDEEDEDFYISGISTEDTEDKMNAAIIKGDLEHLEHAKGLMKFFLYCQYYSRRVILSSQFNYFIILVIVVAGINVGVQTYSDNEILFTLDAIILTCFSIEVILKILSEGLMPWLYWTGRDWKWNNFDFAIVFMSLPFWGGLFGTGSLALLRLVRLMRLGKLIKKIPALQMIVDGLTGGLSSIGYILVLLFLVYYLFAVAGYYFFGENDPFHFGNIPMGMITLFRCSTLDSWSEIMYINIYGCENYGGGAYVDPTDDDPNVPHLLLCENPTAQLGLAGIYFIVFTVMSAMVMLSLFIGTVTMSMNHSMEKLRLLSEKRKKKEAFEKNKAIITAKVVMNATETGSIKSRRARSERPGSRGGDRDRGKVIPRSLSDGASLPSEKNVLASDKDEMSSVEENDTLSKEELLSQSLDPMRQRGPHASIHRAMYVQQVLQHQQEEDPENLAIGGPFAFKIHFHKAKAIFMTDRTADEVIERQEKTKRYLLRAMGEDVPDVSLDALLNHPPWVLKYLHLCSYCRMIAEDERFVTFVTCIIILAGIVVGFQTDPRALAVPELKEALNVMNVIILAVFTLECVLKIAAEGLTPEKYFTDNWNKFDFIIVVGSYIPGAGSLLVILRLLRLLRVLKLVRSLPQLAVILSAMMLGLSSIGYIALILFLVFYVFAILGMILFATNDPWYFGKLHLAMATLFRISTLDDWHEILYNNMFGCDMYGIYNGVYADYPHLCTRPQPRGPLAVIYFVLFVIIGAQVLLTLFIGVVTTSMDQATESKKALMKLEDRATYIQQKYELSDYQMDNFRKCFALLDLDNGGTIEEEELKIGLQIVGSPMTDSEIAARMKKADSSTDGVDLVGFILFMCNLPKFRQKRMFMKVLRLYRAHKKKKLQESRMAHFYEGFNRIGTALLSPRSLLSSPRSPRGTTSQHHEASIAPTLNTHCEHAKNTNEPPGDIELAKNISPNKEDMMLETCGPIATSAASNNEMPLMP